MLSLGVSSKHTPSLAAPKPSIRSGMRVLSEPRRATQRTPLTTSPGRVHPAGGRPQSLRKTCPNQGVFARNSFRINTLDAKNKSTRINTSKKIAIFHISLILNDFNLTGINTSENKDLKPRRINTSGHKDLKFFRINTSKKQGWGPTREESSKSCSADSGSACVFNVAA